MKMSLPEGQKTTCGHCGNKNIHEILVIEKGPKNILEGDNGYEAEVQVYYILVKCSTCEEVSLYSDSDFNNEAVGDLSTAKDIYPQKSSEKVNKDTPKSIIYDLEEAQKVQKISHQAAAILFRKVLEGICLDKKAEGRNLDQKLKNLSDREIIPKDFYDMANIVRGIGNIFAHPSNEVNEVSESDVEVINDFVTAILEYVYVAPAKLEKLKRKIERKETKEESENVF
jgi:hypothetical protein